MADIRVSVGSRIARFALSVLLAAGVGVLLTSCPNPVPLDLAAQITDLVGPVITITEPADRSEYSTVVHVSGTVSDGGQSGESGVDNIGITGRVSACRYSISGTPVSGSFEISADGSFSFDFATRDPGGTRLLTGLVSLVVTAADWNGNEASVTVELVQAETGDVPGFSVVPGNKFATVTWDPIPGATSYSLHNPRRGEIIDDVTSPYVLSDLTNGDIYSLQIQAIIPDEIGEDAWSSTADVIPLSSRTLMPWVAATDYRSVTMSWTDIAAPTEYIVERKVPGGSWQIRAITSGASFTDTGLSFDSWYEYRVTASAQPDIVTDSERAIPGRFPFDKAIGCSNLFTGGTAYAVDVYGSYAYLADATAGLQIINIDDPYAPSLVGNYDITPGTAVDVEVVYPYAYVAGDSVTVSSTTGVLILNVNNPASPAYVSNCPTGGDAVSIDVVGTIAYVADHTPGLRLVDVSDVNSPYERNSYDTGYATGVQVVPPYAYVSDSTNGLAIVNVNDPDSLSAVLTSLAGLTFASNIAVEGSHAYVGIPNGVNKGMKIVNVSVPASSNVESTWIESGTCDDAAIVGSYAYVADRQEGLQVVNIADPTAPIRTGGYDTTGYASGVAVVDEYAYVAASDEGLSIIDIANPNIPLDVAGYTGAEQIVDVDVAGDYAYAACQGDGLIVFDITQDPPVIVGSVATTDWANQIDVAGSYAYVSYGNEILFGLDIFSLADPVAPVWVGRYPLTAMPEGVTVAGDYAYLAAASLGLHVIDVTDPASPFLAGSCDASGAELAVAISGSYAYVAANDGGMHVIDISDPTAPERVAGYNPGNQARDIKVADTYAFVADGAGGLQVISISDPLQPTLAGSRATSGYAGALELTSSYALVASSTSGLEVIDIVDPLNPVTVGGYAPGGSTQGVSIAGSVVCLADQSAGIHVLKFTQ